MNNPVTTAYCQEHGKVVDERFKRDKEDLQRHEDTLKKLSELTAEISALVRQNNEDIDDHENRISTLEKKPSLWLDRLISGIIAAVVAALVAAVLKGNVIF